MQPSNTSLEPCAWITCTQHHARMSIEAHLDAVVSGVFQLSRSRTRPARPAGRPASHPHPHPETLEAHLDAVVSGVDQLQALARAQRIRQGGQLVAGHVQLNLNLCHPHPDPETLEAHLDAVVSGVYELQALARAQRVRQGGQHATLTLTLKP